jgi:site-specific DNA-methyltransferase (adenine-specific)/site-specific DNA-methyltransferase (cytosine-N4-specific)
MAWWKRRGAWAGRRCGLRAPAQPAEDPGAQLDKAEELQAKWNVQPGDLWGMGDHRLLCGDCREPASWTRLLSGVKANGVFTSPPYAEQRKEQYGGTPAAEYVAWWEAVQANVKAHLAPDGSFFVNIKPHCADGERVLYVFDLVLAMKREWGWRFVDELCWKNQGMPGLYGDRLKNQFEPVYHFSDGKCKTRFESVSFQSDNVPTKSRGSNSSMQGVADPFTERGEGRAFPGNVIDVSSASGGDYTLGHAAAFPVALPDFFVRAYSDAGDVWLDPFCGSGTTIVAAHNNKRRGMGIEMLPKYCAVILERVSGLGITPVLVS